MSLETVIVYAGVFAIGWVVGRTMRPKKEVSTRTLGGGGNQPPKVP